MSQKAIRVLGIDTSLRSTGVAVVEARGSRLRAAEYGKISIPARARLSECLARLAQGLAEVIDRSGPEAAAVEGIFYCKNAKTALVLGEARGVASVEGVRVRGGAALRLDIAELQGQSFEG